MSNIRNVAIIFGLFLLLGCDLISKKEEEKELPNILFLFADDYTCLLYTSPSPRDRQKSRMPSSA